MKTNKVSIFIAICGLVFSSCSSDDDSASLSTVKLEVIGLQQLEKNVEYEAWIVVDGENKSLGRFTDVSFPKEFRTNTNDVENATQFKLSIEPGNDSSPEISKTVLLSGNFAGNGAQLDIRGTLGNFEESTGAFMLKTPTDNDPNNEQAGIYWQRPDNRAGLQLPVLPEGWKYEGWVTVPTPSGDVNLSTGTFNDPSERDDFLPYSMTVNAPPNFPGEDFLNSNLLSKSGVNTIPDLRGKTAFVSIEPFPDNDGNLPFILRPLSGVAGNELAPALNTMSLRTASFPVGTASKE
ncbi:hypothetical protein [Flavimarina sp. Hel_I_48]|uniref:hypothetical protein n=1 Tax=Flavimarina sp. Hel_I_48 TaxID=1392488 RepID=UPI00068D9D03|nr:hypothetical protein [Flavimarina sp. Hel_I_48]